MFAELIENDRVHLTADDMPLGADILLHENSFAFTPFAVLVRYWRFPRWVFSVKCVDTCTIGDDGLIYDNIRVSKFGFPIANISYVWDRHEGQS